MNTEKSTKKTTKKKNVTSAVKNTNQKAHVKSFVCVNATANTTTGFYLVAKKQKIIN